VKRVPNYILQTYHETHWGSPEAAMKARNAKAKQLRKEGWTVKCKSWTTPFDGYKTFDLSATAPGFTGPTLESYDSRTHSGNRAIIKPDTEGV
jgi:hypothetical protein